MEGRKWTVALFASLSLHFVPFALISGAREKAPTVARPMSEPKDVWTGREIDVTYLTERQEPAPVVPASAPPTSALDTDAPTTSKATALNGRRARGGISGVLPHRGQKDEQRMRSPFLPSTFEDPDVALARKILEYRPPHGAARGAAEPAPHPADPPRGHLPQGGESALGPPRSFARAFTRAIPAAGSGDSNWDRLELGAVGFVVVTVNIDAAGAIADARVHDTPRQPPSSLERLARQTLLLLRGGRFVLTSAHEGIQTLRIDVTLSKRARESGPLALGFEAPRAGKPGSAYFQLPSGRLAEATVTIL